MSSIYLNDFRYNLHSQNGEDGVLAEIFNTIGTKNKWCCELGAWDGIYLSNTRSLINQGWSGVLIETDRERYLELAQNCASSGNCYPVFSKVGGDVTLDYALSASLSPIPKDFDFLSIDVDGDDIPIWKSLQNYEPNVVAIEVDSSIKPLSKQSSALPDLHSLEYAVYVAKIKGYELALHIGNAIFVKREYVDKLEIDTENWQELFDPGWLNVENE